MTIYTDDMDFPELDIFLVSDDIINWQHPDILEQAQQLGQAKDQHQIALGCFEFVRDKIRHSGDHQLNPVTCIASDVLKHKTGYCYAKSHLLAALLRANGIAAGLAYQRLAICDDKPPFCLHGLNVVYLPDIGWYRMDARGNKPGINAQFTPPVEQLAFQIMTEGEADIHEIYSKPLPEVIRTLTTFDDVTDVANNLPDTGKS